MDRTILAAVLLAVGMAPAAAQVSPPDPLTQVMAARAVADFARRGRDPAAMLVAARMLADVPIRGESAGDASFSPAGLFAEARSLAGNDALLLQQIRIAESTGTRGVLSSDFGSGLVRQVQVVGPRANYRFAVNARAREPLRVGAIGDVGSVLMMRISDGEGHLVCLDDQGDYAPVCQTRPAANGVYRVEVTNKSAARSRTVILSN